MMDESKSIPRLLSENDWLIVSTEQIDKKHVWAPHFPILSLYGLYIWRYTTNTKSTLRVPASSTGKNLRLYSPCFTYRLRSASSQCRSVLRAKSPGHSRSSSLIDLLTPFYFRSLSCHLPLSPKGLRETARWSSHVRLAGSSHSHFSGSYWGPGRRGREPTAKPKGNGEIYPELWKVSLM